MTAGRRLGQSRRLDYVDDLPIENVYLPLGAGGDGRVMRHHDDRGALLVQLLDEGHHTACHLGVEISRWLIGQQQSR